MKRLVMTVALTSALSTTTLAGEVPTVGFVPPAPPVTTATIQATSPGDIPTSGIAQQISNDALITIMLTIFGMLAR